MRVGSLCSGYGGLDMAVGGELAWVSDTDLAATKVLAHHHPTVPNLGDLTTVDWAQVQPVDVITAGWPCQPWSQAGLKKGADDERAIWPGVARAVRMVRPRHVVLENVSAIVGMGELGRAVSDLATLGYVGSWACVRASDVGAPHQRERCFIVASDPVRTGPQRGDPPTESAHSGEGTGRTGRSGRPPVAEWGRYGTAIRRWERIIGRSAPVPTDEKRRLNARFVEWMMGLPEGWVTDVPRLSRTTQLKLLGNGVVPAQAAHAVRQLGGVT